MNAMRAVRNEKGGTSLDNTVFITKCKEIVRDYIRGNFPRLEPLTFTDIYVVWVSKALQNNKAMLATNLRDGLYFEVTYNGDKHEAYVDVYLKQKNFVIPETAM